MRTSIVFLLCLPALAQQAPPPPLEIRGTVTEVGTGAALGDVEVTVRTAPPKDIKTVTDSSGAFHVVLDNPGSYSVQVARNGYTDDGKEPAGENASDHRTVKLDKDHPSASLEFRLARGGEVRGVVIDDDTGKPLANFRVYPVCLLYYHGEISEIGGLAAVTNSEGRFAFTGMRPGKYLAAIGPQNIGKETLLTSFTAEDLQAVDHDYRNSYWPGAGGLDLALPVDLAPGGIADVGTIKARKVSYYRIHLLVPAGGCKQGDKVFISIESRGFLGGGGGEETCGKDVLLRNYEPGSYEVHAMAGNNAENRMRSTVPLDVFDKNLSLSIPLAPGVAIEGQVVVADGAAKPPMDFKVHMWSTGNSQYPDERAPATPDENGRFQFPNRPLARVRVWVTGLSPGFVVREWRYNGSPAVDNIFALNPNAPGHKLEIVVDDKPAVLTGTVTASDTPVARPHVVLIRWPASAEDVFLSARNTEGDENGQFHYAGLAPGEYRILAVAPDTAGKLDEPHVLERLLSRADKLELTAGTSQTLAVKVTDPSR